jgi:hypothetical protein
MYAPGSGTIEDKSVASYIYRPIDKTAPSELIDAFRDACDRHGIVPNSEEGFDLATVLWHAFDKGRTTNDALAGVVFSLVGK